MIKYDFLFDGIPISVVSAPLTARRAVADLLCEGGYAVIVYPVDGADFAALCIDMNDTELREGHVPLAVLSRFFKDVRHYPNVTLEVLYQGNIYNVSVGAEIDKFTVNVGKCKIICAKTVAFDDGIDIVVDVVDDGDVCVSTVCADCDSFSSERLAEVGWRLGMSVCTPAVAVSIGDVIRARSVGSLPFYRVAAIAISALTRRGVQLADGTYTVEVDGRSHSLYHRAGKLTFYPNIKYLS